MKNKKKKRYKQRESRRFCILLNLIFIWKLKDKYEVKCSIKAKKGHASQVEVEHGKAYNPTVSYHQPNR